MNKMTILKDTTEDDDSGEYDVAFARLALDYPSRGRNATHIWRESQNMVGT